MTARRWNTWTLYEAVDAHREKASHGLDATSAHPTKTGWREKQMALVRDAQRHLRAAKTLLERAVIA